MRKIITVMSIISVFTAFAGEREDLLKTFKAEDAKVQQVMDKAMTTIEITGASGFGWNVAEKQLLRVLDWKLRQTSNAGERLAMLQTFYDLAKEIQKIMDESWENTGTIESFLRSSRCALLMNRQAAIWLADKEEAARWKRIAFAKGKVGNNEITLKDGRDEFETVLYDEKTTLEIILFPGNTFTKNGRDFARITTDVAKSANDDFMSVYLCEIKDGKIISAKLEKTGVD